MYVRYKVNLFELIYPFIYKSSTFLRAQGVLRKNLRLLFMLGLLLKQLMGMSLPSSSQPYISTRCVTIIWSVLPWRGSFDICCDILNARYKKGQQIFVVLFYSIRIAS